MLTFFKLKENNTTLKTELIAGFTTFFTMAYIIIVNPVMLSKTGMDFYSVTVATCLAAALGTFLTGILTNYPLAQAPGMGLNAFFTFTVVMALGYTWQQALALVFISGVFFITLTVVGVRKKIVDAIPLIIRQAIPVGIGFFIALIGFNNAGIIKVNQGPVIDLVFSTQPFTQEEVLKNLNTLPPQILELGSLTNPAVLLAILGLFVVIILLALKVKGALFFTIILTTLIGIPMGVTQLPQSIDFSTIQIAPTFFQMDFAGLFQPENGLTGFDLFLSLFIVILSFTLVDLFDTLGTLIGTATKANLVDKNGQIPKINQALLSDAVATTVGAFLGTSTVTTYIESASGISEGGKTGLTAVVVALLFLLAILFVPFVTMIPAAATAPILIVVGMMMMSSLKDINFSQIEEAFPAFILIFVMPFSYSIANGIAAGLIFYTLIMLVKKKGNQIHPIIYILCGLFILRFFLMNAG